MHNEEEDRLREEARQALALLEQHRRLNSEERVRKEIEMVNIVTNERSARRACEEELSQAKESVEALTSRVRQLQIEQREQEARNALRDQDKAELEIAKLKQMTLSGGDHPSDNLIRQAIKYRRAYQDT
ncbi:hypothetical protein BD324DRAFT_640018 [Kockovaella imperatae]|uniref:Uncharacterized protein n=1 Tax=Kockovaella imperatae TaxID=4999 RepID=A0A1Y1U5R3_9TREE|nr:hypothetical protein BD324DRAFT_640018 [Kockovaella imperatae]ORX33368.1 hypothetical protein BD324DRAFT_640018 [Kockovaella imperatae]